MTNTKTADQLQEEIRIAKLEKELADLKADQKPAVKTSSVQAALMILTPIVAGCLFFGAVAGQSGSSSTVFWEAGPGRLFTN